MRPKRIILIRHGQSVGNVDKEVYKTTPDYALQLTDLGCKQAYEAGVKLAGIIGKESVRFYGSSYWRSRQTYQLILSGLAHTIKDTVQSSYYEDPRLVEQSWGHCQSVSYNQAAEEARDAYGCFYYQFRDGEDCLSVYTRVSTILETIFRDFEKENYERNCVINTHGMTMRVLLMRFFHYSVEMFENLRNPKNCGFFILEQTCNGKYRLTENPERYPTHTHPFQFNWSELNNWRPTT